MAAKWSLTPVGGSLIKLASLHIPAAVLSSVVYPSRLPLGLILLYEQHLQVPDFYYIFSQGKFPHLHSSFPSLCLVHGLRGSCRSFSCPVSLGTRSRSCFDPVYKASHCARWNLRPSVNPGGPFIQDKRSRAGKVPPLSDHGDQGHHRGVSEPLDTQERHKGPANQTVQIIRARDIVITKAKASPEWERREKTSITEESVKCSFCGGLLSTPPGFAFPEHTVPNTRMGVHAFNKSVLILSTCLIKLIQ